MAVSVADDRPSWFNFNSPFMRTTESHDAFSASATAGPTPTESLAITVHGDAFSAGGGFTYDSRGVLTSHPSADVFAGIATETSSLAANITVHGDAFAGVVTTLTTIALAVTAAGDVFAGGPQRVAYHVYANTGIGDPINYDSPIDTTSTLTYTTGPLAYPGEYSFGVRAYWVIGDIEEKNLDCAVSFVLSATGADITNLPAPPTLLRAFPMAAGSVRVEWFYPPVSGPKAPTGFHVYLGTGGTPNYGVIAATVLAGTAINNSLVANLPGLTGGVPYTFGVRAFNAVAEEKNTNTVTCTPISVGPAPVVGLTAFATSFGG